MFAWPFHGTDQVKHCHGTPKHGWPDDGRKNRRQYDVSLPYAMHNGQMQEHWDNVICIHATYAWNTNQHALGKLATKHEVTVNIHTQICLQLSRV